MKKTPQSSQIGVKVALLTWSLRSCLAYSLFNWITRHLGLICHLFHNARKLVSMGVEGCRKFSVIGYIVSPKKRYVEVLIPSTSECHLVWK